MVVDRGTEGPLNPAVAILAANFNQGVSDADTSAGDVAALDAFAAANGLSLPTLANVPEPASVSRCRSPPGHIIDAHAGSLLKSFAGFGRWQSVPQS
jgi:hypothetical protein